MFASKAGAPLMGPCEHTLAKTEKFDQKTQTIL